VEVAGSEKNSAVLVKGYMKEVSITLDPSWLPNRLMLDHPHRSEIFNRFWNSAVVISKGRGSLSVIDVRFRHPAKGEIKILFLLSN
jgi:hypothetical protein